jgi:hypothetical protein
MVARLLDKPVSRWTGDEVLDLAVIMLWSLRLPGDGWLIGLEIAGKFARSPGGRGRSRVFGTQPRDTRALAKFVRWSKPRWDSKGRRQWSRALGRDIANAAMLDAINAFVAVREAHASRGVGGLIERKMPVDSEKLQNARKHADLILRVLLRRLVAPARKSKSGPAPMGGEFTPEQEAYILSDAPSLPIAEEVRRSLPPGFRPKVKSVQNRASRLRHLHAAKSNAGLT